MGEFEALYRKLGRKIRDARERSGLSQQRLADRLAISRASIVNVEAGRQRPPLHLLWKIAEALGTDLVLLIPRRDELAVTVDPVRLDRTTIKQIEDAANGDPQAMKELTGLVSKLKTTIEAKKPGKEKS
jgi:transcriptional regulator with XRE-family HTH domain